MNGGLDPADEPAVAPGPPAGRGPILAEIARSITSSLDLAVVLARIAEGARSLSGADTAAIFLRDGDTDTMVPRYRVGAYPAAYEQLRVTPGQGIGGAAWLAERPVRSDRYLEDPRVPEDYRRVAQEAGAVAVMAVPILIAGRVEGLLYVGHRAPRAFSDEDEITCLSLAHQAGIAIYNASVFARERRLRAEAEVLAALAADLTASLDLDRVLRRVAEAARDLGEADVVRIALEEGEHEMRYRYLVGTRATGYETLRLKAGSGFVGRVLETGRPYRVADALSDAAVHPDYGRHFIETEGVKTAMVVPIRGGGRITGLIYAARRTPRPFTEEDERIASRLADYAAIAIQNAESFRREREARGDAERTERRASFIAQVSVLLSASLDLEATLRNVARLTVPDFADFCAVDMVDDRGQIRRVVAVHRDPAREATVRELRDRYGFNRAGTEGVPSVLATGRSAFVPHVTDAHLRAAATGEAQLELLRALGIASWLIVPLTARGRVLGALSLVMTESGRRYALADVGVAEELGRRAAVAIENAQLYRDAQLANQAKDQFLATLSHELRTPINAVYGWARMLRTTPTGADTTHRALEAIERNARAQVQLIEDLLDISRIVSGKMRLDVRPVDVAAVVDAALDAIRPAAEAKELRLETVLDPRADAILGDPDRLQQVVWNLLANAVKFTPRRGRIQVTLRRVNSHVEIAVSDTGIGIEAALLPLLFERFRQGERGQGGLGIGLALVRHLVELHGGTVSAASEGRGHGATFVVKLPVAIAAREPLELAAVPSRPPGGGERPLEGIDVIVVDDDPDALDLVRAILAEAGAEVRTAASAAQGFEAFTGRPPHVVLCDIEMPGEDGYAFVRRVRGLTRAAGGFVPVVALTAYGGMQERIRALDAGFDMHVPKPVDPAELRTVVGRLARR